MSRSFTWPPRSARRPRSRRLLSWLVRSRGSLTRWVVPLGVAVAVLGIGVAASTLRASADPSLPPRSAAQLLVDLSTARVEGLSGTVATSADLGLPAIPGGGAELSSLVSGTHTVRVWYAGPEKVRIALLSKLGETDVIRDGRDVWLWSSDERSALHRRLPEGFATGATSPADLLPVTPQEAADRLLAALDPSTVVSTAGTAKVAGRAAYELVVAPRDAQSLVSQVRLAVDAEHHVPLRVRVFAKASAKPAFEVAFQQITFGRPGDEHFRFTPPPGTTVDEAPATSELARPHAMPGTRPFDVVGSAWTSVLVAKLPADDDGLRAFLTTVPRVSGDWGGGHLLKTRLVTVLVLDDRRVLAGAVTPERLYAVAAGR